MPDQSEYLTEQQEDETPMMEEVKQAAEGAEDDEDDDGLIKDFEFDKGKCTFKIRLPLNADKLLMLK